MSLSVKKRALNAQSLMSTRRIIQLCEESQNLGISSLASLDHQGTQLNSIELNLGELHTDLEIAEENLDEAVENYEAKKLCGLFYVFNRVTRRIQEFFNTAKADTVFSNGAKVQFRKRSDPKKVAADLKKTSVSNQLSNSADACLDKEAVHRTVSRVSSINRTLSEPAISLNMAMQFWNSDAEEEVEQEIEDSLGKITNMVTNLKQMSMDIQSELTIQNNQAERLVKKATLNRNQVNRANVKTSLLLG